MILSHTHQFIFVKTRKVGGTSVEIALSRHLGPLDVATPIAGEDEILREPAGSARNYRVLEYPSAARQGRHGWRAWLHRDRAAAAREVARFGKHMPAAEIRAIAGAAVWDRYFTFTIERNPYDLAVSAYWYAGGPDRWGSIGRFLAEEPQVPNGDLYCIDGAVAVDLVLRYERLDAELAIVARHLGLALDRLPRAKAQYRGDRRPWTESLSAEERRLVERLWGREIVIWESLPERYGDMLRALAERPRAAA